MKKTLKHVVVSWDQMYLIERDPSTGCLKEKHRRLINNIAIAFSLIFRISFILNKVYPNLDFEMNIIKILLKLS